MSSRSLYKRINSWHVVGMRLSIRMEERLMLSSGNGLFQTYFIKIYIEFESLPLCDIKEYSKLSFDAVVICYGCL